MSFDNVLLTVLVETRGGSRDFEKRGPLCRPKLGFRWSKKVKITLETITSWQNISISIFKFSPFFMNNESLPMKSEQFFKFTNALIRKEKKHSCSSQLEKKN